MENTALFFCHFTAISTLQIHFKQFRWSLFVNDFKTYDVFDELISVCRKSMALYEFVSIRCYTQYVLQIGFLLCVDERRRRRKNSTVYIEQLKKENNVLFYMKMGKKRVIEKKGSDFFVIYLASFSKHFYSLSLEIPFLSVFRSVPLIFDETTMRSMPFTCKAYDLPINFHRF